MDQEFAEALAVLRRRIRQSGKQYRQNNDNSESLFHPRGGFSYAYEIAKVEAALNQFEEAIGVPEASQTMPLPERDLWREAQVIAEVHPSVDARNFAQGVLMYLQDKQEKQEITEVHPSIPANH